MSEKIIKMARLFYNFRLHAEPLTVDKRITDTGFVPVQQKTRSDSRWVIRRMETSRIFFLQNPAGVVQKHSRSVLLSEDKHNT